MRVTTTIVGERIVTTVWRSAALTALIAIAYALVLLHYFGSGLAERPLSFRYYFSTLPTAVSAMRGIADDSTFPVELYDYFQQAGSHLTDAQLRASLTYPVRRPDERMVFFKGDDLGLQQFVRASFALFGVSLRAPHDFFFLVLGASLLLFVAAHFREPASLSLGLFFVLAVYAVTFVLGLSTQLWTAIDVRFIGALAILPCLHLALVVASGRWSWYAQLLCLPQAALIAASYQLRRSSVWALMALGVVAALTVARDRKKVAGVLAAAVPLIVTGGWLAAVARYQHLRIHEWFHTEMLTSHLVWHPIHSGLAVHPGLANRYGLTFDDLPAHRAVLRYLVAHDPARVGAVFAMDASAIPVSNWPASFDYKAINWREYERAARDVVFQMARDEPMAMVATFVYYKPMMLIRTLAWATGLAPVRLSNIAISPDWISSPSRRMASDEYLRWFRPSAVCLFALGLACVAWPGGRATGHAPTISELPVVCIMFWASAVPPILVWPAFQWIGDTMIMAGLLLYTVLAISLGVVLRRMVPLPVFTRRRSTRDHPATD